MQDDGSAAEMQAKATGLPRASAVVIPDGDGKHHNRSTDDGERSDHGHTGADQDCTPVRFAR